tara:strand:+ start:8877 stop:9464 length:588 start_codon:yes stop_codon:yes gene_type:complete
MLTTIIFIIIAYLFGSINSAILVCKLLGLPDPRGEGSGNPGTTNVLRLGGKVPAIIVLLLDILKGVIPLLAAKMFGLLDLSVGLVAVAAVLGHVFPLYFKFQGGKGVATLIGVLFAIHWMLGLAFIVIWLFMALVFRISSLAALTATVLMPVAAIWLAGVNYIIPLIVIAVLVVYRHKGNIERLRKGTEPKIGKK